MKAVLYTEPGGVEVLKYQEVDDPVPERGDVVVEVAESEDFINKVKESFVNTSFNTPDSLNAILDSDENELWT